MATSTLRARRLGSWAALGLGLPLVAAAVPAVTEQPRPFGHLIGDVMEQRVLLDMPGLAFEPTALPRPARVGAWFERHDAAIERDSQGRRWLVVPYQVINASAGTATATLPAWELAGPGGPLAVGAWPVSVSPVAPAASGPVSLRPDRPAPLRDTALEQRRLVAGVLALVACLAAWAGWVAWREWRASQRLPFARALRTLSRPGIEPEQSWRELHAAFDGTAGEVVRHATLARLFARAPHLEPQRERIQRFFAASEARFFQGREAVAFEAPEAFCRDLRRLERGAEG